MLDTLASLGEFVGGMAVIGGVICAVIQVRHYRQRRRDAAAMELMHAVLDRISSRPFVSSAPSRTGSRPRSFAQRATSMNRQR